MHVHAVASTRACSVHVERSMWQYLLPVTLASEGLCFQFTAACTRTKGGTSHQCGGPLNATEGVPLKGGV